MMSAESMRSAFPVNSSDQRRKCWLAKNCRLTRLRRNRSNAQSGQEEALRELVRPWKHHASQAILKNQAAELITPPSFG